MLACVMVAQLGYALGSIPTGYLIVRWRTGKDVRMLDSGSTGGRNVARQRGRAWGLASGAGDVAKGAVAVALARRIAPRDWPIAIPAVVAGHVWSPMLGFRGGRGIATALGAGLVADPATGAATVAAFLTGYVVTRQTRPGIALAMAAAPASTMVLRRPSGMIRAVLATVAVVAAAHAPLLRRILRPA